MIPEPTFLHVADVASEHPEPGPERDMAIAKYFAKWGADHEFEAGCEYLKNCKLCDPHFHTVFRDARRPQPPISKREAISILNDTEMSSVHYNALLRALEQLPND
jgi:hypothetical protein